MLIQADVIQYALDSAAKAHHKYEAELGHPDENWSAWYAGHMSSTLECLNYEIVDREKVGVEHVSSRDD